MFKILRITLAASLLALMAPASALQIQGMVTDGDAAMVTTANGLTRSDFSLIGSAWDPGTNTARFINSDGTTPPAPGGATFSIMGAGLVDATGFDSHGGAATVSFNSYPGFTAASVAAIANAALDIWAAVSGFTNLGQVADSGVNSGAPEPGGAIGDIRIAAWSGFSAGVLAHAFQPGNESLFAAGGAVAGDVHFNSGFTWVDDPNDTPGDTDGDGIAEFDLFTVMLHELGHSLGIGHSGVFGSVMEPIYAGARRALAADDIAAIQAIYGAPVVTGVPEPGTLWLIGMGLIALGWSRRRHS